MFLTPSQWHFPQLHIGRNWFNYSQMALILVKYTLTGSCSWRNTMSSRRSWKIRGPLLCWNRSLRSFHISIAEFANKTLADISLEREFKSHEITMLSLRVQALNKLLSDYDGLEMDPSMKPILFLTDDAIFMARLQDAKLSPVSGCETRVSPGMSEWCKK